VHAGTRAAWAGAPQLAVGPVLRQAGRPPSRAALVRNFSLCKRQSRSSARRRALRKAASGSSLSGELRGIASPST
jgi:hypothetical protein